MLTLLEQSPIFRPAPFQSEDFLSCWWTHLAPKFNIPHRKDNLLVHRKPVFKNMAGLNEMRLAGWNSAWDQTLTSSTAETLLHFQSGVPWDYFRMTWLEDQKTQQHFELLEEAGLKVIHVPQKPQYGVDVSKGWEGYLASRSKNHRRHLRRKFTLASRLHPQLQPWTEPDPVTSFFQTFFPHHIEYWNQKSGFSYFNDPREQEFIVAWANALQASGNLRLYQLVLGDTLANLNMSVVKDDTLYSLLSINTGKYTEYHPGFLGLYLRLEDAAHSGIKTVNLGAGDYTHKVHAANTLWHCNEAIMANPKSIGGKLYTTWLKNRLYKLSS